MTATSFLPFALALFLSLPAHGGPDDSVAALVVELSNRERAAVGVAPLATDDRLAAAAKHHARNMAALETMDHVLPAADLPRLDDRLSRYGYVYGKAGENIAHNYQTASALVAGWMASPGHRRNLLDPEYTAIGVGMSRSGGNEPYYCQVFGTPRG